MNDKRIGIIGNGVVGRATARVWLEHAAEVRAWDKDPHRATHDLSAVLDCHLVFICLPEDQVEYICGKIGEVMPNGCYAVKSTTPIGTVWRLAEDCRLPNLVHAPEFLTSRCAITDAQTPARNIIGVPYPYLHNRAVFAGNNRAAALLGDLYTARFPGVPTLWMSSDESEAVKLFTNGFFAVKVAYFNEVRAVADDAGLDWDRVIGGILSDGRIAHAHTQVPGPDGQYGFGGACLGKDLKTLIVSSLVSALEPTVCMAALARNVGDRQRKD